MKLTIATLLLSPVFVFASPDSKAAKLAKAKFPKMSKSYGGNMCMSTSSSMSMSIGPEPPITPSPTPGAPTTPPPTRTPTPPPQLFGTPSPTPGLMITGIIDGPLSGLPKSFELYALADIADLSEYGYGVANNGNGGNGQDVTFPSGPVTAGSFITVSKEEPEFTSYFG